MPDVRPLGVRVLRGCLTPAQLDAIRAEADVCDGPNRRTRCTSCAKILTLIAHIRLLEREMEEDR